MPKWIFFIGALMFAGYAVAQTGELPAAQKTDLNQGQYIEISPGEEKVTVYSGPVKKIEPEKADTVMGEMDSATKKHHEMLEMDVHVEAVHRRGSGVTQG